MISVTISHQDGRVRIDIRDSEARDTRKESICHTFSIHFSLRLTRANRSGLGLFSSRRIVEAHNGEISITNVSEQGACVSVWLPALGPIDSHKQAESADFG